MGFQLQTDGFTERPLEVRRTGGGLFRLFSEGQRAEGLGRNRFRVLDDSGEEVEVELRPQVFGLDVPRIRIGTEEHTLVPRLVAWQVALSALPLLLLLLGGALGGLIGGVAAVVNLAIMRSSRPSAAKALMAVGVVVTSFFLWLAVASALLRATS